MITNKPFESIRLLHVDDDESELEIVSYFLNKVAQDFEIISLSEPADVLRIAAEKQVDCILSDYQMPKIDGLELLRTLKDSNSSIPFVFLTGQGNESLATAALKEGATDYFSKTSGLSFYNRLANSIRNHVSADRERKTRQIIEEKYKESEQSYESLFQAAGEAIFVFEDEVIVDCNPMAVEMLGVERENLIGKTPLDYSPQTQLDGSTSAEKAARLIEKAFQGEDLIFEWAHKKADNTIFLTEVSLSMIRNSKKDRLLAFVRDISKRKEEEYSVENKAALFSSIADRSGEAILLIRRNRILYANSRAIQLARVSEAALLTADASQILGEEVVQLGLDLLKRDSEDSSLQTLHDVRLPGVGRETPVNIRAEHIWHNNLPAVVLYISGQQLYSGKSSGRSLVSREK